MLVAIPPRLVRVRCYSTLLLCQWYGPDNSGHWPCPMLPTSPSTSTTFWWLQCSCTFPVSCPTHSPHLYTPSVHHTLYTPQCSPHPFILPSVHHTLYTPSVHHTLYTPAVLTTPLYTPAVLTTPLYTPCSVSAAVWSYDQSTEKDHWRSYPLRKENKLTKLYVYVIISTCIYPVWILWCVWNQPFTL